ncbi:MAG TPA: hypothetical protein VFT01_06200, partial [Homoserinimonas sp.]|nr:hypothetical protein [Homoserinimonas sp.]
MGAIRRCTVGALIVLASATLVGCTDTPEEPPEPTSVTESPSSAPEPEAEPEPDPELVSGGTAEENLPYFDFVNSTLLTDGNPGGRAIVDNLVTAGFDKP